jgi:hypothetical protein
MGKFLPGKGNKIMAFIINTNIHDFIKLLKNRISKNYSSKLIKPKMALELRSY